jgi:RNA polymerase sigma-70 factor (ECF subfamily)
MRPISHELVESQSKTDTELLHAVRAGQTAALGTLYDRYASLVYGLALAILTSPQEAEDLTQDIFLALSNKCDYDPARGSLNAYLVTLTRSRAIDKLRARGTKMRFLNRWSQVTDLHGSSGTPFDHLSLTECSRRVREALAQLPEHQRQVLELAYYKDLSQTEIADRLKTPLGTIKTWTRTGLFTLRRALQDLIG